MNSIKISAKVNITFKDMIQHTTLPNNYLCYFCKLTETVNSLMSVTIHKTCILPFVWKASRILLLALIHSQAESEPGDKSTREQILMRDARIPQTQSSALEYLKTKTILLLM